MELKANKSEEQTYLFSKEFEKEGIYTVTKVKYTSGNAEYELLLEDEGIEMLLLRLEKNLQNMLCFLKIQI